MINRNDSLPPCCPQSCHTAMPQYQHEGGRFNDSLITAADLVENIVSDVAEGNNFDAKEFAKSLITRLVRRYKLPTSQLLPIFADAQNPTTPNDWTWSEWEGRHYSKRPRSSGPGNFHYRLKNQTEFNKIIYKLEDELGRGVRFETCKNLPCLKQFRRGRVSDCKDFSDLAELHSNQLLPLTPLICECIQVGLFKRDFINMLHAM
ncbi:hypothetical protein [Endozoicomonas sp. ONNA2]|uniref:hypothetical protein n=1 Tax=Endozoicomonas sp. ONNA2 TaxID=2828741 RepID=UPI0021498177|nr:hypothetical protein [Endozoicomonas sp. ONNA2]